MPLSDFKRREIGFFTGDNVCVGVAALVDQRLFSPRHLLIRNCAVMWLAESPSAQVWGVVCRLHDDELAALDGR